MDKYLNREESYQRLLSEYKKYGSLIVCVDFDDTLYDFHKTGGSYDQIIQLTRDLHAANCYIIIWTGNQDLIFIEEYLSANNIPHDSINDEAPISKKMLGNKFPRKVYANIYIDDRAGMCQVYDELTRLLKEINHDN
jgi:hypothetical protein